MIDAIRNRRSVRRYKPEPIPRDVIETLLTAAIWAPSAHNRQPWRFAVIEVQAVKEKLARAMGQQLRHDLEADHVPEAVILKDVNRSHKRIISAPVLIVLCLTMKDMDSYPDEKRTQHETTMAIQSVAMAGQNLLLAAHNAGLGACWMCAPLFCPNVVRQALDLPEDWQPQALLTVGYPLQQSQGAKTRESLMKRVLWR